MNYTTFIEDVLNGASEIARQHFGKVAGIRKDDDSNQVLTQADLDIGKFIIGKIFEIYPDYNIIDEEAGVIDKKSEYTWVIDPIDGTSNFAVGAPGYGIIIGLLHNEVAIAGGVALPYYHEIITAETNIGAFDNGVKLEVTKETNLLACLVTHEIDGHQENPEMTYDECKTLANIVLGIRNLRITGSVFDGMLVAKGKFGAFMGRTSKIWDNVGVQVIIEEVGGVFTDFFGNKMDYSNPLEKAKQNFTRCMGSVEIHRQLQEIIHKK